MTIPPGRPATPGGTGARPALKPILRQPLGPVVKEPEPASVAEVAAFFEAHGQKAADRIQIAAGDVRLAVGPAELWTLAATMDEALRLGSVGADLALTRSLLLFEMLHNVQLPALVIATLLQRFRLLVNRGAAAPAWEDALLQVVCACSVETYANAAAGMSRDLLQVSRFSQDALKGAAMTGMLSVFKKKEQELKQKVIEVHQYALSESLNQFMLSLADARQNGDYARAFDAQKRFFELSATITETAYWRQRAQTQGLDLADELDASAVGATRPDATAFADALAAAPTLTVDGITET